MAEKESSKSEPISKAFASFFPDQSAHETTDWVSHVQEVLGKENLLINGIASQYGNLNAPAFGGFYSEVYQTATFNINAAVKQTGENVVRLDSNAKASPDIHTSWGKDFGLKFNKDAESSLYQQAKPFPGDVAGHSQYAGMGRLIPSDQIDDAKNIADHQINKFIDSNPASANRYQETKGQLTDRIVSPAGAESKPITKSEVNDWAHNAKHGEVKKISIEDSLSFHDCLGEIMESAGDTALINASLRAVPIIWDSLNRLVNDPAFGNKEFLSQILKWMMKDGLEISVDTFIKSSIASSLTLANKLGVLEGPLQGFHPSVYAVIAITSVEAAKKLVDCANNKCTGAEAADHIFKTGLRTSVILSGKIAGQTLIPIPIVGGIIGSIIASYVVNRGIDLVDNSVSIILLKAIDKHFGENKQTLALIFENSVNYEDVYKKYSQITGSNEIVLKSQITRYEGNESLGDNRTKIVEQNDAVIGELIKRQSLFNDIEKGLVEG